MVRSLGRFGDAHRYSRCRHQDSALSSVIGPAIPWASGSRTMARCAVEVAELFVARTKASAPCAPSCTKEAVDEPNAWEIQPDTRKSDP